MVAHLSPHTLSSDSPLPISTNSAPRPRTLYTNTEARRLIWGHDVPFYSISSPPIPRPTTSSKHALLPPVSVPFGRRASWGNADFSGPLLPMSFGWPWAAPSMDPPRHECSLRIVGRVRYPNYSFPWMTVQCRRDREGEGQIIHPFVNISHYSLDYEAWRVRIDSQ
jgi:hypothetical protein